MKMIVDTKENCAKLAARQYQALLAQKPDAVLGYATGSTPLALYDELIRLNKAGEISFQDVTTFNLDEYVGLDEAHPQSYRFFMNDNLFDHIDIDKAKTHVPSGLNMNNDVAALYDKQIEAAGGIDLQLLGLGNNGHIGFNEPGTPIDSVTHVVTLEPSTREANKRFFASIDEVPAQAVSMGVKSVMNARAIILMAFGANKAKAVKAALQGRVDALVPASILQLHPFVTVYLDPEAASLL